MKKIRSTTILLALCVLMFGCKQEPYEPTLESLAKHPIPEWWDEGKFGIFIHWGPYAVPGYGSSLKHLTPLSDAIPEFMPAEWYWLGQQIPFSPGWFHHLNSYGLNFTYDDFLPQFTADKFDPDDWISLFEKAGAKYFVLTSKHHDGFALWPTDTTGRNSAEIGAKRDLVGELFAAAERADNRVKPGLYYSIPEFFNPAPAPKDAIGTSGANPWLYGSFTPRNAYTQVLLPYTGQPDISDYADDIVRPQLREIIAHYKPYLLWCDIGGKEAYFRSNEIIAEYYNDALISRTEGVLINSRCGDNNTHRDYEVVEQGAGFAHDADESKRTETARTMGESWGYDKGDVARARSANDLIAGLAQAVAKNSNYLLNIGPRADGTIPDWMRERLLSIGRWLKINGEAVYKSRPWDKSSDEAGNYFTVGESGDFYILATDINEERLVVNAQIPVTESSVITLLGSDGAVLPFQVNTSNIEIDLPVDLFQSSNSGNLPTQVLKVSSSVKF